MCCLSSVTTAQRIVRNESEPGTPAGLRKPLSGFCSSHLAVACILREKMASSTRFGIEAAAGQPPQIAATGAFTDELTEAVNKAVKHLLSLQASEGYWIGELEAD